MVGGDGLEPPALSVYHKRRINIGKHWLTVGGGRDRVST